ncbi:hypothetical protein B9Z55_004591 [Caenorhabditis nigoni]|uniref:GH18 domain-containing protein n=1 Tax=Caenorhabditis nigoni TaxID=1611254 RepID=A0A2G5UX35_9PELO|nr:hypothetical protein B9Z55_004591 [Caenorhabditis nigoni]
MSASSQPFLKSVSVNTQGESHEFKFVKVITVTLIVIFVCGLLAFGLSAGIWHVYDIFAESTTQAPLKKVENDGSAVETILAVLFCGILSLGLSAAVWYYFQEFDADKNSPMTTVPSIKNDYSTSKLSVATSPDSPKTPLRSPLKRLLKNNSHTEPCPKRVVGYFSEWEKSELRKEQLQKLTHVIYLFVPLQENGTIDSEKVWADSRFGDLKNKASSLKPGLKLMIGVGGSDKRFEFRQIVSDDTERKALIDSITSFIVEHDLDGVDVFWKWPFKHTRISYVKFLRELRTSLDTLRYKMYRQDPYIISIIAPRIHSEFDGFDLEEIMRIVDFVNVLTYDYFYTTQKVGPLSPLYGGREGNVDRTMKYLTCMTENPNKLNLGVAFYGTTYNDTDSPFEKSLDNFWISRGSTTTGPVGTSWNQISSNEKEIAKWDNASRTPYTWDGRKFFTFENERSLREKIEYAKDHNIGGIVIWVIDQDDDKSTLLNVVYSVFMCTSDEVFEKEIGNEVASTELSIANVSGPHLPTTNEKRIVGYFTEWERSDLQKAQLEKLTHVIYLFVPLQDNATIKLDHNRTDNRFWDLKNKASSLKPRLKVMVGVGGHETCYRFSPILADDKKRKILIDSITSFLDKFDLDGIEVFWTWPSKEDRHSYVIFLQELRTSLNNLKYRIHRYDQYIISTLIPRTHSEFEAFKLEEIIQIVDFINVQTYNYYFTTLKVGPNAPLYGGREEDVDKTMKHLFRMNLSPEKLNLAVAFFGIHYENTDSPFDETSDDVWIPMSSETKGPYGKRWDQLTSNDKTIAKWNDASRTPYTYDGRRFFSFDNERSVTAKIEYAKENNIGGIVIWVIDQDDEKQTLLNVVYSVFRSDSKLPLNASCRKRVIGYFTEWENADLREEQLGKLTHVIFLFATVQESAIIKLDNYRTETRFLDLKDKAHSVRSDLKMMIGVGGISYSYRFPPIVLDDGKRKILVESITSFIDEHDLDGVEIFWVWSYEKVKLHYSKFIRELRESLNNLKTSKKRTEDYLISIIVPPKIATISGGYYINEILESVDFLNVLTYDYYFNGDQVGPHSPIYGGTRGNIDETMKYLAHQTSQPSKLNMAVPFYGTFWSNASLPLLDDSDEIWKEKGDAAGPFAVRWRELVPNSWNMSTTKFHEKSKTSYIWIPETKHFLTFENERSLAEKAKYVKEHQLGGILIWAIDQDDDDSTLLNVVSSALGS